MRSALIQPSNNTTIIINICFLVQYANIERIGSSPSRWKHT